MILPRICAFFTPSNEWNSLHVVRRFQHWSWKTQHYYLIAISINMISILFAMTLFNRDILFLITLVESTATFVFPRRTLIIALPCAQVEFTDPRWIPLTRRTTHICGTECEVDVVTWYAFPYLEIRSRLTVLPRENVIPNYRSDLDKRTILISRSARGWSSSLTRTILYRMNEQTRPAPSLPSWRLGGFPLPRNSLGKRFRELGGRPWTLESATLFPKGPCGRRSSRTSRNLGQGWFLVIQSEGCRSGAVHPIKSSTQTFECVSNPIRGSPSHYWP